MIIITLNSNLSTASFPNKLTFIKILNSLSSNGLYSCKDSIDRLFSEKKPIIIDVLDSKSFIDEVKAIDDYDVLNILDLGTSYYRDLNILKLGIGDKKEYVDFIMTYYEQLSDKNFLIKILSRLDKNNLKDIVVEMNDDIKNLKATLN